MIWEVLQTILIFVEVVLCYLFSGTVLAGKEGVLHLPARAKCLLVFGIMLITYGYCWNRKIAWFSYPVCILMILIYSLILHWIYKRKYIYNLYLVNFYYVVLIILDYLMASIYGGLCGRKEVFMNILWRVDSDRILVQAIPRVLLHGIMGILWKTNRFHIFQLLYDYRIGLLSFLGYPIIFVFMCLMEDAIGSLPMPSWSLLLVLMLGFCSVFVFAIVNRVVRERVDFIHMKSEMMEQNYHTIMQLYEANAREFHDFKNHINILYTLAEENRMQEVLEYIEAIRLPLQRESLWKYTGNKALDIILSYKIKEAKDQGIDVITNIQPLQEIDMEAKDLCTLWGNMLDNAIEACLKRKTQRWISVSIQRNYDFLFFLVENSIGEKPLLQNGRLVSSKKDKLHHGWGISGIELVVEKYQGMIETGFDHEKFYMQLCFSTKS